MLNYLWGVLLSLAYPLLALEDNQQSNSHQRDHNDDACALRERCMQKPLDGPITMPAIAPLDRPDLEQSVLSAENNTPSRVLSMEPTRPPTWARQQCVSVKVCE